MLVGEFAPAAPLLIDALPSLLILAALFFVVGCIYVLRGFVTALFGAVASIFSKLPVVGGLTSGAIHSAEQAISNALGTAEAKFDAHIAAQFHRLAGIARHFWHELEQLAHTSLLLAEMLSGYAGLHYVLKLAQSTTRRFHALENQLRAEIRHTIARAKALSHSVAQGVYPRLRAVEHDVTKVIPKEIKATRTLAKEAEAEAARAWRLVKDKPWEIGDTAFAGAVALALADLGLGGLRCNSLTGALNRRGCGLWNDLEDLLGLAGLVAGALSFEELVHAAQGLTEEAVSDFEDVFGL
jgi:hypothetical protein